MSAKNKNKLDKNKINEAIAIIEKQNKSVHLHYLDTKNWGFEKLNHQELKNFNQFIYKVQKDEFDWDNKKRPTVSTDLYRGQPVFHYELSKKFRVHGIWLQNNFELIRIDPHHDFSK